MRGRPRSPLPYVPVNGVAVTVWRPDDAELRLHLGLYSAHKFRAAIHLERKKTDEARDCIGQAYGHWEKYTTIMSGLYRGVDLQRNRALPDWHAYDDEALKDFTGLGGRGKPVLPK